MATKKTKTTKMSKITRKWCKVSTEKPNEHNKRHKTTTKRSSLLQNGRRNKQRSLTFFSPATRRNRQQRSSSGERRMTVQQKRTQKAKRLKNPSVGPKLHHHTQTCPGCELHDSYTICHPGQQSTSCTSRTTQAESLCGAPVLRCSGEKGPSSPQLFTDMRQKETNYRHT